jgi:hypothetical protein
MQQPRLDGMNPIKPVAISPAVIAQYFIASIPVYVAHKLKADRHFLTTPIGR